MKILLVEDNHIDVKIHTRVIEKYDPKIEVVSATNGKEGLKFLKANQSQLPDIILLDIFMPEDDGWYFLDNYRFLSIDPNPLLIVLSSSINPHDIKHAEQYEYVTAYFKKPFLKESVSEMMRLYKSSRNCNPLSGSL